MATLIKKLEEVLLKGQAVPPSDWHLRVIQSEQCQSYVVWNELVREALIIDPKQEDLDAYLSIAHMLKGYLWLGVIDTHTHADHISVGSKLAQTLGAPLIMHALSPSRRVQLRVSQSTTLPSHQSAVHILVTPGHTPDSLTVIWGPFLFGGDTLLFGDTGRDDLPGGDPEAHFESIQCIKTLVKPETIVLPGHDHLGGRASDWKTQLEVNPSLTQKREDFIRESRAFDAPAPLLLKESLRENFK